MALRETIEHWHQSCQEYDKGNLKAALQALQQIADTSARLRFNEATIHLELGQFDDALQALNDACERDPYLAAAFFLRGFTYYCIGQWKESYADLYAAFELVGERQFIDYTALGLPWKLYRCELLHNLGLAAFAAGYGTDADGYFVEAANPTNHHNKSHDALKGNMQGDYPDFFEVPGPSRVFAPPKNKVSGLQKKQFMKQSELRVALFDNDKDVGFQGQKVLQRLEITDKKKQAKAPPSRPALSADALKLLAVKSGKARPQSMFGTHRAVYNYTPVHDGDLELMEGDIITLREDYGDGWYRGTNQRLKCTGVFPAEYVEALDTAETDVEETQSAPTSPRGSTSVAATSQKSLKSRSHAGSPPSEELSSSPASRPPPPSSKPPPPPSRKPPRRSEDWSSSKTHSVSFGYRDAESQSRSDSTSVSVQLRSKPAGSDPGGRRANFVKRLSTLSSIQAPVPKASPARPPPASNSSATSGQGASLGPIKELEGFLQRRRDTLSKTTDKDKSSAVARPPPPASTVSKAGPSKPPPPKLPGKDGRVGGRSPPPQKAPPPRAAGERGDDTEARTSPLAMKAAALSKSFKAGSSSSSRKGSALTTYGDSATSSTPSSGASKPWPPVKADTSAAGSDNKEPPKIGKASLAERAKMFSAQQQKQPEPGIGSRPEIKPSGLVPKPPAMGNKPSISAAKPALPGSKPALPKVKPPLPSKTQDDSVVKARPAPVKSARGSLPNFSASLSARIASFSQQSGSSGSAESKSPPPPSGKSKQSVTASSSASSAVSSRRSSASDAAKSSGADEADSEGPIDVVIHHGSKIRTMTWAKNSVSDFIKEVRRIVKDEGVDVWYRLQAGAPELKMTDDSHLQFLVTMARKDDTAVEVWCRS